MIFDTHAHYDTDAFDADRDEVMESLQKNRICAVNVGADIQGARDSVSLASRYPFLFAAAGIHPDDIGVLEHEAPISGDEPVFDELIRLLKAPRTVAVGEIGLDYHWMVEEKAVQKKWFAAQLRLSVEMDLPINVHCREAVQDTLDIVRAEHGGRTGGIIHAFSGSVEIAREYVKMGYYLGIGGVVTFKNGRVLREVVREIPIEHLVTETDSPYLSPVPYRGKRNWSGNIPLVIDEIARVREMDRQEAEEILWENALKAYRIRERGLAVPYAG